MGVKDMKAYHFVGDRLRDGREVPADGVWLEHEGDLELCASGLHASRHVADALQYAPGNTLCLVECEGEVIEGDDKLVCSRRKIIARFDAEQLLRDYAREVALNVWQQHFTENQYPEVWHFLRTGEGRGAAWAAAWAAWAASWAASWAAARAASWAAEAAARAAPRTAAWAAGTAQGKYRARLAALVDQKFEEIPHNQR